MITALIFILVLSVLVFVHEFGHFITAKRAGMKVEEFGFGFPPRLFGIKRGETIYSLNWIPFGGFVKILGEDGEEKGNPRSFANGKLSTKALVIVAGVVMNFVLAIALMAVVNSVGLRTGVDEDNIDPAVTDVKVQILQVAPNSPAEAAGLRSFDEILGFRYSETEVSTLTVRQVQDFVSKNLGRKITVRIKRGGEVFEKEILARSNPPPEEGALGVALASTGLIKYPWYKAIWRGVIDSLTILKLTIIGYATLIKNLFVTGKTGVELSGPIGIAVITGQAARLGLTYLLQFTALISINLSVLNIIPFPALDGGRLLFIIIEKLKGSPIPKRIEGTVNAAGFTLLVMLMIYITTKDIIKFF